MESFATQIIMATRINKTLQNEKMHIPKTNALFVFYPIICNIICFQIFSAHEIYQNSYIHIVILHTFITIDISKYKS